MASTKKKKITSSKTSRKTKKIRVNLRYVVTVEDDFDTYAMGRNINTLAARGVLAFCKTDEEIVLIDRGAHLTLTAVGRMGRL